MVCRSFRLKAAALVMVACVCAVPGGADAAAKKPEAGKVDPSAASFFERKIRPVLVENCYKCHSSSSEKVKGGLLCDSREALLKGGDSGPCIVPGNPAKGSFIRAISYKDPDLQMPPKVMLPEQAVADLTKWVQMGAPWPSTPQDKKQVAVAPEQQAERWAKLKTEHWSWQPVKDPAVPNVGLPGWAKDDLDKFVLAGLETKGLKPVGDADRVTLIRRVTFDLTGLPPKPEEVIAFVSDKSPDAYAKVVDRLLASAQFGETWGRHWLDVARFAESTGSTRNYPYKEAWRYRDYVIDSFNADKPYNTFVMEQVAGDLMPAKSSQEQREHLIATGYLAMGVKDLNEKDREKFAMDNVDEQIDTVSRSILATTVACARCHDHKFDPIPTTEYYQLAGIFRSTSILAGVKSKQGGKGREYGDPTALINLTSVGATAGGASALRAPAPTPTPPPVQSAEARIQELQERMQKLFKQTGVKPGDKDALRKLSAKDPAAAKELVAVRQEMQDIRRKSDVAPAGKKAAKALAAREAEAPRPSSDAELAMGVREGRVADCRVNIRGDHDNLGPSVPRGYVSVIKGAPTAPIPANQSGRLQLAAWMASPKNPLTARVMTNRIWHYLFGDGIVRTVDNFGTTGEAPSNQALLDHLALRFIKNGWSVKSMVRAVVLSHAYQLASSYDAKNYQIDPDNRLVWRHSQKRLDFEQIRDAMLAIGQSLDLERPTTSVVANLPDQELREGRKGQSFERDGGNARSVYAPVVRALLSPMMDTFDAAEPTMVTGDRDVTTVATQALFMMNNDFTVKQSRRLAQMLLADSSIGNDDARIDQVYGWTLGRSANKAEKERATAYLTQFVADAGEKSGSEKFGGKNANEKAAKDKAEKDKLKTREEAWTSFVQAVVASAEFRYLN